MGQKLKTAILISGRGSNMRSLHQASLAPDYPAEIVLVLSNKANAAGLDYARENNIPTAILNHKDFPSRIAFDKRMHEILKGYDIDLICLAGFMRILSADFVAKWPERILNIHPSLLPKYKGLHPQKQALDAGDQVSGCSVHLVTAALDGGPVLDQKSVPILSGDTEDSLSKRILTAEHILFPAVLKRYGEALLEKTLKKEAF